MDRRLALALVLALALAARPLRAALETPAPRSCSPEGRGAPPRHWLGCASEPGPPRALAQDERLVLGLPVDVNAAGAHELAFVPGLSRSLAAAVVEDRDRNGRYAAVEELLRVRGLGPKRLARARPHLGAPPMAGSPAVR
jgi:competence protein ComEA